MRVLLLLTLVGCVRDPAAPVCPDLAPGALAITEVRKAGTADTQGSWLELYNTTGGALELEGLKIRFRDPEGKPDIADVVVRRSLSVTAGAYVVLGLFADDDTRPAYIDYGVLGDFSASWPSATAIDVDGCSDTLIDRIQYATLPSMGTYSLGTMPPTADANDFSTNWCTDLTPGGGGTPQKANTPCP